MNPDDEYWRHLDQLAKDEGMSIAVEVKRMKYYYNGIAIGMVIGIVLGIIIGWMF